MAFTFVPPDGYRNTTSFPTKPSSEAEFRDSMQDLLDQIRDFLNNSGFLPTTGGTVTGDLIVDGGSGRLKLKPGSLDHIFMEFYARTATPNIRTAYMGYSDAGVENFTLNNIVGNIIMTADGDIQFNATGGKVYSGTNELWHAGSSGPFFRGTGSPEGSVTAPAGSIYQRTDGSTITTLYVKTSGSGNTGWTAK